MLKKIKFKGGFFTEETELELFMREDRISLLYGKNGSGKSTISKAVHKAKGDVVDDIVQATLFDQEDIAFADTQCIHVFNEDYVSSRVKIRNDGLNTIVLLGELGNLEDKILDLELRIEAESNRNAELKTTSDEYKDKDSKKSPSNCRFQINLGLSGDSAHKCGKWAGICGEMGADTELTEQFLRMGVDELSVAPSMVLKLRQCVRNLDLKENQM